MADEMNGEREAFEEHLRSSWEDPYMAPERATWSAAWRASLAANAGGEPVAEVMFDEGKKYIQYTVPKELLPVGTKLYTHPSPPEGMAGWKLVPIEPTDEMLAAAHDGDREYTLRNFGDVMTVMQGPYDHWAAMITAAPPIPASEAKGA